MARHNLSFRLHGRCISRIFYIIPHINFCECECLFFVFYFSFIAFCVNLLQPFFVFKITSIIPFLGFSIRMSRSLSCDVFLSLSISSCLFLAVYFTLWALSSFVALLLSRRPPHSLFAFKELSSFSPHPIRRLRLCQSFI